MGFNKRLNGMRSGGGGARDLILAIREKTFLDRPGVIRALDDKRRKIMLRLGGFTRAVMQRSMKTPRAPASKLRGRSTTDFEGKPVTIDNKGRVVDRHGQFLPKKIAADIKKRVAIGLAKGQPSTPGKPPNAHIQTLKKLIEFGYEAKDETLVIGPHKIQSPTVPITAATVPELLDAGGSAYVHVYGGATVKAHFAERPFREPALDKGWDLFQRLTESTPLTLRAR